MDGWTDMSSSLSVWGEAVAAKRFPGHYRGLREHWMHIFRHPNFWSK